MRPLLALAPQFRGTMILFAPTMIDLATEPRAGIPAVEMARNLQRLRAVGYWLTPLITTINPRRTSRA